MNKTVCKNVKPVNCVCGSTTKGKGRLIECSSRNCGRCVSRPRRTEAIIIWNEMNALKKAVDFATERVN
jgi:hypothetical protein